MNNGAGAQISSGHGRFAITDYKEPICVARKRVKSTYRPHVPRTHSFTNFRRNSFRVNNLRPHFDSKAASANRPFLHGNARPLLAFALGLRFRRPILVNNLRRLALIARAGHSFASFPGSAWKRNTLEAPPRRLCPLNHPQPPALPQSPKTVGWMHGRGDPGKWVLGADPRSMCACSGPAPTVLESPRSR